MVNVDGKLDVTAMSRTSPGVEMACRARIVEEWAERGIVKTANIWVEKRIEGDRLCDSLDTELLDILGGESTKADILDCRRDRM